MSCEMQFDRKRNNTIYQPVKIQFQLYFKILIVIYHLKAEKKIFLPFVLLFNILVHRQNAHSVNDSPIIKTCESIIIQVAHFRLHTLEFQMEESPERKENPGPVYVLDIVLHYFPINFTSSFSYSITVCLMLQ